ncbi:MAG TPA: cytochrome-c peroxidase [Leucothrix mucor]|nr:cytochrome-c peroxidase [Leucothrix mucor]
MKLPNSIILILMVSTCASLSVAAKDIDASLDQKLRSLSKQLGLTGVPHSTLPLASIDSPLSQLGMKLFYSKSLGGEYDTACVSCHHPVLGGGDNLSLPIGAHAKKPDILGKNRKLKAGYKLEVPRNAPSTFNIAFYKKTLFHDGRIQTVSKAGIRGIHTPDVAYKKDDLLAGDNLVQAQARFPVISAAEMRGDFISKAHNQTVRRALANRLKSKWLKEFQKGFSDKKSSVDDLITEQNVSAAIAEYERSQIFINNPWKQYLQGNNSAISIAAKKGALLFFTAKENKGANCSSCHSGDFFTDEAFHNTAIPQIGMGNGDGTTKTNDYGRWSVTKKNADMFRFRTPTLLNIEVTGPWGHDGAYTSLEAITRHMLSPQKSIQSFDKKQLTQKQLHLDDLQKNTAEAIKSGIDLVTIKKISKEDVKNIVSFLKTLTDPCVKSRKCLAPWIPKKTSNDPDGLMLHGSSRNRKLL